MRYRIANLAILLILLATPAFSAVEIYQVHAGERVPAWVSYTLNCPADVTIEVFLAGGGPPVRTVAFPGQSRGKHQYLWTGIRDDGTPAPEGAYYARIAAESNQTRWDPIIGIFKNDDWTHEYSPRPLPDCPNSEGFYGIGINKNPDSPYYGRIYISHRVQKHVFMYDPDGEHIGQMDDSQVSWGPSAPWDISIAEDDFVYVDDRSSRVIHCFTPDGQYMSTSPALSYSKTIFARKDAFGVTHVFQTGGPTVRRITLSSDHLTWGMPCNSYTPGTNNLATLGIWVSPDLSSLYNCYSENTGTANPGLTRWQTSGACTFARDSWTSSITNPIVDADMSLDGSYLWVTRMVDSGGAIHKVRMSDGTLSDPPDPDHDIVSYALMCCTDNVGNIGITFGKNNTAWAQFYWGIFAEPGASQAQKMTPEFVIGPNSGPVMLPDSAVWTLSNPDYPDRLPADDISTATLEFRIYDSNGWTDIESCTLDLSNLGYGIVPVDSITQDTDDPNGLTAVARKEIITARRGVGCGLNQIPVAISDYRDGHGSASVGLRIAGVRVCGYIGHTRYPGGVGGATARIVGGEILGAQAGSPGSGPFTYTLGPTDANGYFEGEVSEGMFQVSARKPGRESAEPVSISVTMPTSPPTACMDIGTIYLRPCTVAEARALTDGVKVNIEGVCYAWPAGPAPEGASGLATRVDTQVNRNQWYICNPDDPESGMLCMITAPDSAFTPQWDDPGGVDGQGTSTCIGRRPVLGETVMLTGMLDTPGGHERRILAVDDDIWSGLQSGKIERYYLNRGILGGLRAAPKQVTCAEIARNDSTVWGRFVRANVWIAGPKTGSANTYIIADSTGTAELLIQTPSSLGLVAPLSAGCMYTITGAAGRTVRYGNGCIRVRHPQDVSLDPGSCEADDLPSIRSAPHGAQVRVSGIVTGKWADFFYIEDEGRQVGIRVLSNSAYAIDGACIKVIGTLGLDDGERVITPSLPPMLLSTGNAVSPPYDLRTRDIGGSAYDPANPGVTDGRGALNIGLRVHLQGMVTARDPGGEWFYIWDGANSGDLPVGHDSAHLGIRVQGSFSCVPWVDWADVIGIVSTDCSIAAGRVIPVVLATSVEQVRSFDTITSPAGEALQDRWNLFSIPAAPAAISDGDEWSPKAYEPYIVLGPSDSPDDVDQRLLRWENCTGGLYAWDQWSEVGAHGPFGGLLVGDGYWLRLPTDWAVSYSGKASTLDQWVGICARGWSIIGHPKDHATALADVKVHDGGQVITMYDAVMDKMWIDCTGLWWDNVNQGLVDVGIPDCFASTENLLPWHGYWLRSYRGGLTLVVPE